MRVSESRTSRSIRNAKVSLLFYFLLLILGFFSRRAFFQYLGSEVLGLNTTAANLLGFLNLAELGICSAVSYFLYKPLAESDRDSIKRIIIIQGWLYRRVAMVIIGASCLLICFFPLIFDRSELPLWYAYATFGTLLFSALLGYFFNYRQILLTANQQNYLVQYVTQGMMIVKVILQILAVSYLPNPFLWWIALELLFAVVTCYLLDRTIRRVFPWLRADLKQGRQYSVQFPDIIRKTKQVFVHKLGGVVLQQSSPLIVYAFTSLTTVAYYGNYILLLGKLTALVSAVFNSSTAAIGNLVASGNKDRIVKVFWELYDSRFCISSLLLVTAFYLANPFITLWLGSGYLLGTRFLMIYAILQGILMIRTTVDDFIDAHGLYQDVYSPVAEAILNIGLSILLGYHWGLEGIIGGVVISQLLVIGLWKPYFLFTRGIKDNYLSYYEWSVRDLALVVGTVFIIAFLVPHLPFYALRDQDYLHWTLFGIEVFIVDALLFTGVFSICSSGFRAFLTRISHLNR